MEPLVLAAGSVVGAFTAMAIDRVSKGNAKLLMKNSGIHSLALQRRVITEAMNRVYDHERQGKITSVEREMLLTKYRQELETLDSKTHTASSYNLKEINAFKESLVALMDRRMAQISARLDDIANRMSNTPPPVASDRRTPRFESREERRVEPQAAQIESDRQEAKPVQHSDVTDSVEGSESDASLDEIKKQIMQTLSRLEQAEVE
jgi:hypothetical protein